MLSCISNLSHLKEPKIIFCLHVLLCRCSKARVLQWRTMYYIYMFIGSNYSVVVVVNWLALCATHSTLVVFCHYIKTIHVANRSYRGCYRDHIFEGYHMAQVAFCWLYIFRRYSYEHDTVKSVSLSRKLLIAISLSGLWMVASIALQWLSWTHLSRFMMSEVNYSCTLLYCLLGLDFIVLS